MHDGANQETRRFLDEGEVADGLALYYAQDHLGSVRDVVDATGNALASYDYDPYGQPVRTDGAAHTEKRYAGMYYHAPSGLYLTHYRAYDPASGRWLSRDPIGEVGGVNLYSYVGGNPLNFFDSLGLYPTCESIILGTFNVTTSHTEERVLSRDYGFAFVVTGPTASPNLDPRRPRQPPIAPSLRTEVWWALRELLSIKEIEKTKTFQNLKVFCTELLTDECGNSREFNTNFERTEFINEIERLAGERIETRKQLLRFLFVL